ncbi:MAG: hypothetical protein PHW63_05425 [Alphaproteobacteria bacterium]|nr:hypothetical protein [Alphaproteobacteria bacterium]
MTMQLPPDEQIIEELIQSPARSLADALDEMVTEYLCGGDTGYPTHEDYLYRKSCYYQSYYPYTHAATWWKRFCWRFKKVNHPLPPEQTTLVEAAEFFLWIGRQTLHRKLQNGEAKAFGYNVPRSPQDKPLPVPPDVWGENMSASGISWPKSEIKENHLSFCAVQIVFADDYGLTPDNSETANEPHPATTVPIITSIIPKPPKLGRRTLGSKIDQAIVLLYEEGILKPELSQRSQIGAIRDQVKILLNDINRDDTDLGEDAIGKRLSKFFKKIKADKCADK